MLKTIFNRRFSYFDVFVVILCGNLLTSGHYLLFAMGIASGLALSILGEAAAAEQGGK